MHKVGLIHLSLLLLLLAAPITASADDRLDIAIATTQSCDQVSFTLTVSGGIAPYAVDLSFGDTETFTEILTNGAALKVDHTYPAQGEYKVEVKVTDYDGTEADFKDTLVVEGPSVTLKSSPFPPLLIIEGSQASITFRASVSGGVEPYVFAWDLDNGGAADPGFEGLTAGYVYSEAGKYSAAFTATDACGLVDTDTLTVVVDDPREDAEGACHPTAQKIAEAVSSIFPDRAEQTYTCEDIFHIFEGGLTGFQLGFGRMWKAYQFTQTIDDLTWEEILDWKLAYSSWGALKQLNQVAELLDEYGIRDLYALVVSEDYTVGDVRTAARSALRYEADFEDALARVAEGANAGELGQFYRLANELEVDPEELDGYLADGMSLSELRHAAKLSERANADWTEILGAKSLDVSWGEISQAYKLADDQTSALEILAVGVKEYRAEQREADHEERSEERNARTADRLAQQLGVQAGDLMALFNGECDGSWSCVRKKIREEERTQGTNDRDLRTAAQLASKYALTTEQVMGYFTTCGQDWNCVKSTLRDIYKNPPGKNK